MQELINRAKIKEFHSTLDKIEVEMTIIRTDKRTDSWMEVGNDILKYIGYTTPTAPCPQSDYLSIAEIINVRPNISIQDKEIIRPRSLRLKIRD